MLDGSMLPPLKGLETHLGLDGKKIPDPAAVLNCLQG